MDYVIVSLCAFVASLISFYSGFGLGTVLMPIFAIFFSLPIAIGLTAIVHLFHNLIKAGILWKWIHWKVGFQFGGVAIISASIGAWLLQKLTIFTPIKTYSFMNIEGEITILHMLIGLLIIFFATIETFPQINLKVKNLYLGGVLSGFFGGLSGHQGALRSLFLVHLNLRKEAFIGTSALISTAVDLIRILIYGLSFRNLLEGVKPYFLMTGIAGALFGILVGLAFLQEITIQLIRKLIAFLLYILGVLLIIGIL